MKRLPVMSSSDSVEEEEDSPRVIVILVFSNQTELMLDVIYWIRFSVTCSKYGLGRQDEHLWKNVRIFVLISFSGAEFGGPWQTSKNLFKV